MNKQPKKAAKPKPPVSLQKMPDGSFRIHGLGRGGQVHLKKEMRAWRSEDDEQTGESYYTSWSRQEAETYARAHGLTILEPRRS